ncbi:class I SAM-dependent methyltransferase [Halobacillus sp. Marseille-P3879]|uniref:class I SAM-dependent methyltransferase n=1 Tax=Halobacillus sp. Marseille-P3879 TaxID=2045014 RepID=UPI000C7994C5|nr:class I SAM-dependent methyltransferase [Halobacillus sp. Marseille-P3879]
MSEHYYSKSTSTKSEERSWTFRLREETFTFTTDHAVFSKSEVDFGSRVLLDAYTSPDIDGDILDLGCGYGPIGLAIAKGAPDRRVYMVDVNERALELARKNAEQNEVENVTIKESDRFSNLENHSFAAIVTNPPIRAGKQVVHAMFTESFASLKPQGELWVVIQKKQGAPSAKEKLEEMFGSVELVVKKKGYYILKAKKV